MNQNKRNEDGQTLDEFLNAYSPSDYDRPSVTLDIAIMTPECEVLLIQRNNHPNIGTWALPGGFLEMQESLYQGAMRELEEETGVKNIDLAPLGMFGDVNRDPRTRIITMAFGAMIPKEKLCFQAADDAADARLFAVKVQKLGTIKIPARKEQYPDVSFPCTAFGEPIEKEGIGYIISLKDSKENTLSVKVARSGSSNILLETPANPKDGRMAGDHGLILFTALQHMFQKIFEA